MSPLLSRILFLRRIYFTQTPTGIFYFYLPILLIVAMISLPTISQTWFWIWASILAVSAYLIIRSMLRWAIVKRRLQDRRYIAIPHTPLRPDIASSTPSYELQQVDEIDLIDESDNWKLYDATFDFYRETKYGRYLAKQAYYTVFEIRLNRQVPNIIFDSKSAKRRQFKYLYLHSQRVSFEGNFDKYFDSYAPHSYTIDLLSFVTPEVMLALIDARNYDIELIDDRLLLYGPLLSLPETADLKAHGMLIARHLNDNLDNYRDDRLTGLNRTQKVSFFGQALLKNPIRYAPLMVLSGAASGAILYGVLTGSADTSARLLFNQISLVVFATFIGSTYSFMKIVLENRRQSKQYQQLLQTQPMDPTTQ